MWFVALWKFVIAVVGWFSIKSKWNNKGRLAERQGGLNLCKQYFVGNAHFDPHGRPTSLVFFFTSYWFTSYNLLVISTTKRYRTFKLFAQVVLAWFSDGPGRSQSRPLSLARLMDFIQGHVRDVMTLLFFPPIRSNVIYSRKSGILGMYESMREIELRESRA